MNTKQRTQIRRSGFDRRLGADRRFMFSYDYSESGNTERRQFKDRRNTPELRKNWIRVTKWSSVCIEEYASGLFIK